MSVSSSQSPDSWIASFCSLMGHEYFAEVSEDFIEDDFNLTGLQSQVPMYKDALEMILDVEPSETASDMSEEEEEEEEEDDGLLGEELDEPTQNGRAQQGGSRRISGDRRHTRNASDTSMIESSAELLYGLIHARYITSRPGIQQMLEKYELSHFGHCPRVYCHGARVLPVGLTDTPGQQTVKLFCPSCYDVYNPPNSRFQAVDGAFFGTTFGCLFFMTFPDLEVAPRRKDRAGTRGEAVGTQNNGNNNDDAESSVLSPTETNTTQGGMTASRSSSLTLSNPPINLINQAQANKEEKAAAEAAARAALPPQPLTINGIATSNLAPGLGRNRIYEPKIYGFRVSEQAKSGPRMKWLRSKPEDINELDEARRWHDEYGGDVDGNDDEEMEDGPEDAEEGNDEQIDGYDPTATTGGRPKNVAHNNAMEDKDGDRIMGSQGQLVAGQQLAPLQQQQPAPPPQQSQTGQKRKSLGSSRNRRARSGGGEPLAAG